MTNLLSLRNQLELTLMRALKRKTELLDILYLSTKEKLELLSLETEIESIRSHLQKIPHTDAE